MVTLGFISLTAPAMLGGLALLALPIAAHLLHRRAKRRVVFPSIVLLAATKASQSQWFKLRRLLLLMVRCAIVAMLVLAFAQPLWVDREAAAAADGDEGVTVLVLDASASASQRSGGMSGIEWLRSAAGRTIDDASARGDAMNVVVAAGRVNALFPQLTHNAAALRAAAAGVEPTAERADLFAAIAEAGKLLGTRGGPRRLVVLSDLQASNWVEAQARLLGGAALPEGTRVTIVPPDGPAEGNVALVGARTSPARPMAGHAARAVATVANFGDAARVARVELLLDGVAAATGEAMVEPWQQAEVSLPLQLPSPGEHRLTLRLRDRDALAIDDSIAHVARSVESRAAVLLTDEDPADAGTGAYFLARVISPHGDERDALRVRVVRSEDLDPGTLRDAAGLFIGYTAAIPRRGLEAVRDYLAAGGAVVVFCGSGPVDRNLAALDGLDARGLLPHRVTGLRDLSDPAEALSIADGDWRSPLLRAFDTRSQVAFAEARFRRVWEAGELHPEASALLRFSDGSVALSRRPIGLGTLVVASFSAEPSSGDLPKHGSFVALIHSLLEALEPEDAGDRASRVGESLRLSAAKSSVGGSGLHVVGPAERAIGMFEVIAAGDTVTAVVPYVDAPGFYNLRLRDQRLAVAAARIDPRESDLRRVDRAWVESLLGVPGGSVSVGSAAGLGDSGLDGRRSLWGWAIAAALACAAVEMGLVGYWRR